MIAGDEPSAKRIKSEITNGHDAEAETSMQFFSIIVLFFSFKSFVTTELSLQHKSMCTLQSVHATKCSDFSAN